MAVVLDDAEHVTPVMLNTQDYNRQQQQQDEATDNVAAKVGGKEVRGTWRAVSSTRGSAENMQDGQGGGGIGGGRGVLPPCATCMCMGAHAVGWCTVLCCCSVLWNAAV